MLLATIMGRRKFIKHYRNSNFFGSCLYTGAHWYIMRFKQAKTYCNENKVRIKFIQSNASFRFSTVSYD